MNETPRHDVSVGFSDASYVCRDEMPKTPRCYADAGSRSSGERRAASPIRVAGLCLVCFFLGALINAALYGRDEAEIIPAESSVEGFAASAAISAAVHADTPPESLAAGGRPYLGVIVQTVSRAAAEYYNQTDSRAMVPGVQIYAVESGGPACRAGLCSGDIILRLDDTPIATAADLTRIEETLAPGTGAVLTVYRAGEYRDVPVVFSAPPAVRSGELDWCDFDNAW